MRRANVEELRNKQIEILDYVSQFCEENEINYWLDCGTLLGAVRHEGYIPWDDDIDIAMHRSDYNKFLRYFPQKSNDSKFELKCIENNKDWHHPFAKVMNNETLFIQDGHTMGINIDIFPYDDMVDDMNEFKKNYKTRDLLKVINSIQCSEHLPRGNKFRKCIVYIIRWILRRFPKYYFIRKISEMAQKHNGKGLKTVGSFTNDISMKSCKKEWVSEFVKGSFEGKQYNIPVGYKELLTCLYGEDYMQLPPEEKRKKHTFEAYVQE